jgi:hypothetical protein
MRSVHGLSSAQPEEHPSDAIMEFFIGTWAAIALIAEGLAGRSGTDLEELIAIMADAEQFSEGMGGRHIAIRGVRTRLEALVNPGGGGPGDGEEALAGDQEELSETAKDRAGPLVDLEDFGRRRVGRR